MSLAQLPQSTIKLIGSGQVITSVSSVVKELMENSIDSGAHHVEIKLDKHGLEKIEVKDDGCGIGKSDAMVMCLPSYTSKISDFSDMDVLSSYGFRGEALSSLCNLAQVNVTTKTPGDEIATCYTYDHNGQVTCSKISHLNKGTIVTVTDLFKNLPVRKQFVSSSKRAAEELKRVEKIVKSLAMVHPRLRVTLIHNKFLIWQKTSVANLRQSVMQIIPFNIVKQLHHTLHNSQQVRVEMLSPKLDCDVTSLSFSALSEAFYLFINNRPVNSKEVEKAVYNKIFGYFGHYVPANKYPVCVLCLTLPPDCLDVNLEPNKTRIYFKNKEDVLDIICQCMYVYYGDKKREVEENQINDTKQNRKRKVEEECEVELKKALCQENIIADVPNELNAAGENLGVYKEYLIKKQNGDQAFPKNKILDESAFGVTESTKESETNSCHKSDLLFEQLLFESDSGSSQEKVDEIFEDYCLTVGKHSLEKDNSKDESDHVPSNENQKDTLKNSEEKCSKFFSLKNKIQPVDDEITNKLNDSECGSNVSLTKNNCQSEPKDKNNQSDELEKNNVLLGSVTKEKLNVFKDMHLKNVYQSKESLFQSSETRNFILKDNDKNKNGCQEVSVKKNSPDKMLIEENENKQGIDVSCLEASSLPTLSQWSRGNIFENKGNSVQGLTKISDEMESQTSPLPSNRSVTSQMGCKEMSAFVKFARNMRKEILAEHPKMSFTKVAQTLQIQWRHLNSDEKKKFEEAVKTEKVVNSSPPKVQKTLSGFLAQASPQRPSAKLAVNMSTLREAVINPVENEDEEIRLIGQLEASPLWLYRTPSSQVTVLSSARLMEAVKFHQYVASYTVPAKVLDEVIQLAPSDLRKSGWNILCALEKSPNGIVNDARIISNGFFVEINEGENEAYITYVPQNISYCGLEELQEILDLLETHGLEASVSQCRPLKVISYLRSEVMRECSKEEPPSQPEEVSELLSYWLSHVAKDSPLCIHHQPVTSSLVSS